MHSNRLVPLAHSRVEHLDQSGFPTISIHMDDSGRLVHWTDYVEAHNFSIGTQRAHSRAIGLYIDWLAACGTGYAATDRRALMFRAFADALSRGTVEAGRDGTGLYWLPRTNRIVRSVMASVSSYSAWLVGRGDVKPSSPERDATVSEQMAFWHSWRMASKSRVLSHLDGARARTVASAGIRVPYTTVRGRPSARLPGTKAFPDGVFRDLLVTGFAPRKRAHWTTLRDRMVSLLLHEGGLRISEPFHIWVSDVLPSPDDGGQALVRVFHPSEGMSVYMDPAGRESRASRSEILRSVYDRVPLTEMPGKQRVGWKDPMLGSSGERSMTVFWRSADAGLVFMELYRAYMRVRPLVKAHPYLFITPSRDPMTSHAFRKVHAAAVRRIGLVASKEQGTTPHGHRHAYGQYLRRCGVDPKVISVAMHHKSIRSQEVYTSSDESEVYRALARLHEGPIGSVSAFA